MEKVSNQEMLDAGLADWRKLAQALHARYLIPDYVVAAGFVAAVAQASEADCHRPELRVTHGAVDVSLCTHEDGLWVTQKDIDMARRISEIARENGLEPAPTVVTELEIALDTAHEDSVAPFWSILLTGSPENKIHDSIFDPTGRVPGLWFQGTEYGSLPMWPINGLPQPWPPAGPSSTTLRRHPSPCSPTRRQPSLHLHLTRARLIRIGQCPYRSSRRPRIDGMTSSRCSRDAVRIPRGAGVGSSSARELTIPPRLARYRTTVRPCGRRSPTPRHLQG